MIITFSAILFSLVFLFRGLQKNNIFLFHIVTMIAIAYYCEYQLGWKVFPFSKNSFLLFIIFHLPLINIFTFFAYGKDKSYAKRGEWRIPEIQLHTLEILGGTIGAFVGQKFFHHKNKKKSFLAIFWVTTIAQVFILYYIAKYFYWI